MLHICACAGSCLLIWGLKMEINVVQRHMKPCLIAREFVKTRICLRTSVVFYFINGSWGILRTSTQDKQPIHDRLSVWKYYHESFLGQIPSQRFCRTRHHIVCGKSNLSSTGSWRWHFFLINISVLLWEEKGADSAEMWCWWSVERNWSVTSTSPVTSYVKALSIGRLLHLFLIEMFSREQ